MRPVPITRLPVWDPLFTVQPSDRDSAVTRICPQPHHRQGRERLMGAYDLKGTTDAR